MDIEDILKQVANGQQVRIKKGDLPPEQQKLIMEMLKPNLLQKGANLFTGKLNSIPGYGEYSTSMAPKDDEIFRSSFLPEADRKLSPEKQKVAQALAGFNSATDPKSQIDLMKIFDPETANTLDYDPFGNPYVTQGKNKLYLNKPGVSTQDVKEIGAQTAGSGPAIAALAPMTKIGASGASLMTKILTGMGYGAASSLAADKTVSDAGGKQGFDLEKALTNAVAGGGFEALAPVISKIGGIFFNVLKSPKFFTPAGDLKPGGIKLMADSGVDWNSLSQETQKRIQSMVQKAANPEDVARYMSDQDLPGGPIRLTKGQQNADIAQYSDEDLLRSGGFGDDAAKKMGEFDKRQAGDIRSNVDAMGEMVNPGAERQTAWGAGGKTVAEKLQEAKLATKTDVDAAFQTARDKGGDAYIPSIDSIHKTVLNNPDISPVLNPALMENKSFAQAWKEVEGAFGPNMRGDSVSVQKAYELLPKLNAIAKNDPMGSYSVRELKRTISKQLADDALVASVQGDETAVAAFQNATKKFKDYANTYRAGDIVETLTEQAYDPATGKMKFVLDPVDGSKVILGANRLGIINKTGTKAAMETLQKRLPPEAWNSLREEVLLRSLGWTEKDFMGDGLVQSAAQLKKGLSDFKTKSPELYNTLFSGQERGIIEKFNNQYGKATLAPQTKSTMGSRTTPLAMRAAQQILPILGPKMRGGLSAIFPTIQQAYKGTVNAAKATSAVGSDLSGGGISLIPKSPALSGISAPMLAAPTTDSLQGLMDRYGLYDQ